VISRGWLAAVGSGHLAAEAGTAAVSNSVSCNDIARRDRMACEQVRPLVGAQRATDSSKRSSSSSNVN